MKRLLAIAVVLVTTVVVADELAVGAPAPAFSAYAFRPGDERISVVVFTCNQCPYAQAFEPRLIEIAKRYQSKGVVFYAIDPNDDARYAVETLDNMKERAVSKGYPFPYLKDGDSAIARAYGARVTPHVYVIDPQGVLRYRGYIDDSARPEERTKTGLTDALDALLANRDVAVTITRAFGCTIKFKG